jgi:para-nitrobenzyl esterase
MHRYIIRGLLVCTAALASSTVTAEPKPTAAVQIEGGQVAGQHDGTLAIFKGIPFAAPPVRELRWRPPQPVVPWQGVRVADRYSPMCLQPLRAKHSVFYLGEEPTSEDCLYLNVWTPGLDKAKRPVMVFVYGGGWVVGSGSMPLYAGDGLARKGAVVVTFNYRVGALGFFAHPALSAESGNAASGNYGLMDMVAALKWVRANIARFGGDPGNVTLYGQSSGAAAISLLLASPQAEGLFQRVIGQSGGYALGGPLPDLAAAEKKGVAAAEKMKAPTLQALRNLGGDAVMASDNFWRPTVDGVVLRAQPAETFGASRQMRVPALLGATADEGTAYPVAMSAAAFAEQARTRYGERAEALLALYPARMDEEARAASYALHRDRTFVVPVREWATAQARVAPVFMYHFARVPPFAADLNYQQQSPASRLGAYHGAEMAYAYAVLESLNWKGRARDWTDADRKLSEVMSSYWFNFARSGDPNGPGLPAWPKYAADAERVMLFADGARAAELPNKPQLDFFKGR